VDGATWELGHKDAEEYVNLARETIKAMLSIDNSIKFVASGSSYYDNGQWVEWNRKILTGLGDKIDYISIHSYWGNSPDYQTFMGQSAMDFEQKITVTTAEIEAVSVMNSYKNPIYITIDEWGTFGRNFLSVLPIAQSFNSFIRHADIVKMANYTMLTSLLGSDLKEGTYKTPLFYLFQSFSNNCLGYSLDTYVNCDTFNTASYNGIPYLDVSAVYSKETNTIFINVVNRHKDNAITTDIINIKGDIAGNAVASIINCESLTDPFAFEKKEQYIPVSKEIKTEKNKATFSFPAHSYTQIKIILK
jgi:alpha-N-arabinofuranosidase